MGHRFNIRLFAIGLLLLLAGAGVSGIAWADTLETLVMPGPVAAAHQKIEGECAKCHAGFGKASQKALCVSCHEKIGADIKAGAGYHGRDRNASSRECKVCHSEHKGRNFDIVGLNRENFDHGLTDFKLSGAHLNAACSTCHVGGKKMREAPSDCFSCHQKEDVHKGSMGKNCASCHSPVAWRTSAFDHSKTKFPLTGAHANTQCSACHPSANYKNTPTNCASCHGLQDIHHGTYGAKCDQCHSTAKWAAGKFDHARTAFPLLGRHAALACATCHTPVLKTAKLATGCVDCHKADDVHKGGNGAACKDCHSETSWKTVKFDHDKETKFPLRGSHKALGCHDCHHEDAKKVKLQTTCVSCHGTRDPHKAQLGTACATCHNENKWRDKVRFDHDLVAFPLLGMHATAPCEACHLNAAFKDAGKDCVNCHGPDDIHKGSMGKACASCHNPNGWAFWQFNHDKSTKFPLAGAHAGLACKACHKPKDGNSMKIADTCISCHAGDDTHAGRFGPRCEQCHGTDSFKNARIRR
jgi:hypothetical protein